VLGWAVMKNTSNNFVAGLFVIGGVAGFVLIVLLLSGVRLWGGVAGAVHGAFHA